MIDAYRGTLPDETTLWSGDLTQGESRWDDPAHFQKDSSQALLARGYEELSNGVVGAGEQALSGYYGADTLSDA